ncbi:P-loop NTPase fold protein [uncultured Methanomethylovorans sp.]|uniref:P-loop NTPase fold protein n=1 Tax=uncultured Methanomethylovorans sp. TaxID=183759 RepID=UPI002AA7A2EE|nr:P-loop NTPase fold protein [uncultured Methanomethylovorans sp.]
MGGTDSDKEISQKLMLYSSVLDVFSYGPSKFIKYFSLVFGAGLFLILSSSQNINALYLISIFLIIFGFSKEFCDKVARVFEEKAKLEEKPLSSLKNDLKKKLSERKNKILIIIDDIDRLNNLEIKQIFQLVKVNTDFPNIIYLMAFDKEIIERNLDEPDSILGRDYLKKIVQVDFDVPAVKKSKIKDSLAL